MLQRSKNRRFFSAVFIAAAFFMLVMTAAVPESAFAASGKPAKVKGVRVTGVNTRTVTVSFKSAKRARKYQVYRAVSKKGKFKKVKTTKKTAVKISGLKAGTKYYFKVRGVNGKKKGRFSKTVSGMTKLETPVIKVSSAPSGITVSWNRIPAAKGYLIYRKNAGSSYRLVKTIKGAGSCSYKDSAVGNWKKYQYSVRAYCGAARSGASRSAGAYYYAAPEKAEMLSPTVENTGIGIQWKPAANAYSYEIYRKKHGSGGKYRRILTVTYKEQSAVDRSADYDRAYDYYVIAVNHGLRADASSAVSGKRLHAPYVKAEAGKKGVTVTWEAVDGASKYLVGKFDKAGVFEQKAEISADAGEGSSAAQLTYTDAFSPSNGKRYTYGVRVVIEEKDCVSESAVSRKTCCYVTAPKTLTVYHADDSSLTVGFKINKKATGQLVQISRTADFAEHTDIEINNLRTYLGSFTELEASAEYCIRARNYVIHEDGTRSWSAWSKAYKAYTKDPGMEEGTRIVDEEVNDVVEDAISWIDGRISVLDTATAKVLGAAAWQDDDHFSCSSLVTKGYRHAGVKLPTWFFSSTLAKKYLAHGFIEVTDQVNTKTGAGLKRGDVLLNKKESHTGMYLGYYHGKNNMMINATKKHWTTKYNGASYPWKRVFRYAGNE